MQAILAVVIGALFLWLFMDRIRLRRRLDRVRRVKAHGPTAPPGAGQTEHRLRGYLQLLDALINTIPNPIYYTDAAGVFRGCNRAFAEEVLGITRDRIIGCRLRDLPKRFRTALDGQGPGGQIPPATGQGPTCFETGVTGADGRLREYLLNISAVAATDGQPGGHIAVMIDLTEKNRFLRERLQKEKLKGVLETAGAVCHELNQPLQVLSGYTELALAEDARPGDRSRDLARKMIVQTERMADITRKLQAVTRYETVAYGKHDRIINIHQTAAPSRPAAAKRTGSPRKG